MTERLVITAMGKQTLYERLKDVIWTSLNNQALDASDEKRAASAADAVMTAGDFQSIPDHGSWSDSKSHS